MKDVTSNNWIVPHPLALAKNNQFNMLMHNWKRCEARYLHDIRNNNSEAIRLDSYNAEERAFRKFNEFKQSLKES